MKVFFVCMVLLLTACDPRPIATSDPDAQRAADTMAYVQDARTGLCYGVISSMSPSGSGVSTSMSATNVPCEAVARFLKKK